MTQSPHSTIGRNDPCHCGSGKKFKHCHGGPAATSVETLYGRMRRYDDETTHHLLKLARDRYGKGLLDRAWTEYTFSDGTTFNASAPGADPFERWCLFNWKTPDGNTLAEIHLADRGHRIDPGLRSFIEATARSPYSFLQVTDVERGAGLTLRDIFRKRDFRVTERLASEVAERGHIVLARVVEQDGISFFMGVAEQIILPRYLTGLVTLREKLEGGEGTDRPLSDADLLEHETDLRRAYFELERAMSLPPEVRNTDGDPLELHTLTYQVPSFEAAFDALRGLEQRVTGSSVEEMLLNADRTKKGKAVGVTLHWLKIGAGRGLGDNTMLATLEIRRSKLTVDVNSARRAKLVQKEIDKRLGDEAVLIKTEIRSQEGMMRQAAGRARKPAGESDHERILRESPEIREQMKAMMDRHWTQWPETPLPALRGLTPRQAAKDPAGRELLESLLLEFEDRNETAPDEISRPDVGKLRRELGMENT